ncbi:uncharacterized protein LY79DRAFT_555908 [Colletotrichum navitas]|uniref:Uncharacterized protein n=1 Tax=Colletotrichum navitas TaxID=681940 RepID=A0AAD8PYR8_9PEZI|nr:uncharacterized protein LY79DRAFT_555908 [Colletotrichum navitas]KAK1590110.1 hypothetical protein LY79DRAFT_555908 [Colletotrichum navitas]
MHAVTCTAGKPQMQCAATPGRSHAGLHTTSLCLRCSGLALYQYASHSDPRCKEPP